MMMICMLGCLLLALAAIDFRTFRRVNVLHAVLSLRGSLTVRIIYPGRQLKQLAMAAPGLAGCKGGGVRLLRVVPAPLTRARRFQAASLLWLCCRTCSNTLYTDQ